MGRRQLTCTTDRGGTRTTSPRLPHPRLATTAAALLLGLGLAAAPIDSGGPAVWAIVEIALAALATITLAVSLTARPSALGTCLLLLAGEYLTHQMADGASTTATILYASGLLSLGQLCGWANSDSRFARIERRVLAQRLATLAAVAASGALVATLALLGGSISAGSALAAAVIGSLGCSALLALVLTLQRQYDLTAAHAAANARGARADRSRLRREKSGG